MWPLHQKIVDYISVKLCGCNNVIVITEENVLALGRHWGVPRQGAQDLLQDCCSSQSQPGLQNRGMPLSSKEEVMGLERPAKSPVSPERRGSRGRERGRGTMPGEPQDKAEGAWLGSKEPIA